MCRATSASSKTCLPASAASTGHLLIIAANEGVMPQTREHLAILDLLGIEKGIVVVTKKDLVDEEWLELVRMDIDELIKPTVLSKAPVVPVSSVTREGLPERWRPSMTRSKPPHPERIAAWPRIAHRPRFHHCRLWHGSHRHVGRWEALGRAGS